MNPFQEIHQSYVQVLFNSDLISLYQKLTCLFNRNSCFTKRKFWQPSLKELLSQDYSAENHLILYQTGKAAGGRAPPHPGDQVHQGGHGASASQHEWRLFQGLALGPGTRLLIQVGSHWPALQWWSFLFFSLLNSYTHQMYFNFFKHVIKSDGRDSEMSVRWIQIFMEFSLIVKFLC